MSQYNSKLTTDEVEKILLMGQDPEVTLEELSAFVGGRVALGTIRAILTGDTRVGVRPDLPRRRVYPIVNGVRTSPDIEELRATALGLLAQGLGPKVIAKKLKKSAGCIYGLLGFGGKPYIRTHCTCCHTPREEGHAPDCIIGKWLSRGKLCKESPEVRGKREMKSFRQYAAETKKRYEAKHTEA